MKYVDINNLGQVCKYFKDALNNKVSMPTNEPKENDAIFLNEDGSTSWRELNLNDLTLPSIPGQIDPNQLGIYIKCAGNTRFNYYSVDEYKPRIGEVPIGISVRTNITSFTIALQDTTDAYVYAQNPNEKLVTFTSNGLMQKDYIAEWLIPNQLKPHESGLQYTHGDEKTKELLNLIEIDGWETASSFNDASFTKKRLSKPFAEAAALTWRYKTAFTTEGEWYLPSMLELFVVSCNLSEIYKAFDKVGIPFSSHICSCSYRMSEDLTDSRPMVLNINNLQLEENDSLVYVRPFSKF